MNAVATPTQQTNPTQQTKAGQPTQTRQPTITAQRTAPAQATAHAPNIKAVLTRRSLDQLEDDIIALSQHINATEYEFLVLLREFDLRQGWKAYHFNNCAEWLNMKCGMAPRTARDKLRVANALFDLPAISGAFQKGDLSYSKARSLCRVATPRTESDLLDFALTSTAGHVEKHCIGLRNAMRGLSTRDANRLHRQRHLTVSPNLDGSVTLTVELPQEQAGLVIKALELAVTRLVDSDQAFLSDGGGEAPGIGKSDPSGMGRSEAAGLGRSEAAGLGSGEEGSSSEAGSCDCNPGSQGGFREASGCGPSENVLSELDDNGSREPSGLQQRQADALVELARTYLAGAHGGQGAGRDGSARSCTADHYQVTVHVDVKALRGAPDEHSRSDLPIETVRRLCCDGAIVPLVKDASGKPVGLGRKHRVVSPSLKRALLARDKGCCFPGCTHTKWLDAHHVLHWADGGATSADNLVMLCSTHHRLLHEGGFEIKPGPNGDWQFRNASRLRQPDIR